MRKGTKIALVSGALLIAGAAGLSTLATAEYRGSHGWGHHGKGHQSGMMRGGMGHRGMMRRGMGHKGMGMHAMMERADANSDGKLTQDELDDARKNLLAKHDGNKDGKLNLAEFEKLWLDIKRQRMVRGFQKIDRDGDASVTLDEFMKPFAKFVSRMDSNDDGVLDDKDHRRHMGGMGRGMGGKKGGMGHGMGKGGMGQGGMGQGGMGKSGG